MNGAIDRDKQPLTETACKNTAVVVQPIRAGFHPHNTWSRDSYCAALSSIYERNRLIAELAEEAAIDIGPVLILVDTADHAETLARSCWSGNEVLMHNKFNAAAHNKAVRQIPSSRICISTVDQLDHGLNAGCWPVLLVAVPSCSDTHLFQAMGLLTSSYKFQQCATVIDLLDQHILSYASFARRKRVYREAGCHINIPRLPSWEMPMNCIGTFKAPSFPHPFTPYYSINIEESHHVSIQ